MYFHSALNCGDDFVLVGSVCSDLSHMTGCDRWLWWLPFPLRPEEWWWSHLSTHTVKAKSRVKISIIPTIQPIAMTNSDFFLWIVIKNRSFQRSPRQEQPRLQALIAGIIMLATTQRVFCSIFSYFIAVLDSAAPLLKILYQSRKSHINWLYVVVFGPNWRFRHSSFDP